MERCAKFLIALWVISSPLTGCDKTQTAANRLMKGGRWKMTEITVGTSPVDKLPKWAIDHCENETASCTGTWEHAGGTKHPFHWQFLNFGGDFVLSVDPDTSQTSNMAYAQCFNFSGGYKVTRSRRNSFHFESSETQGYPGKLVVLVMEKDQ